MEQTPWRKDFRWEKQFKIQLLLLPALTHSFCTVKKAKVKKTLILWVGLLVTAPHCFLWSKNWYLLSNLTTFVWPYICNSSYGYYSSPTFSLRFINVCLMKVFLFLRMPRWLHSGGQWHRLQLPMWCQSDSLHRTTLQPVPRRLCQFITLLCMQLSSHQHGFK